jgi:hypothetical protein
MRWLVLAGLLLGAVSGCAGVRPLAEPMGPPVPLYSDNPLLMPVRDSSALSEALSNVVDDYFRIESEEPVRTVGGTLTEGRIDTFPEVGSTVLEPWRHDSADPYERAESTLQSIRREAHVRVIPAEGGFLVDVAVFKELEDVKRPAHVSAGAATFRTEGSLTRVVSPIGEQEVNKGWIRLGRDRALEQRILAHLQETLGVQGLSPIPPAVPASQPSGPSCQPPGSQTQPSGPSSPPRCASGSETRSAGSGQRTAYRLVVSEGTSGFGRRTDWQSVLQQADWRGVQDSASGLPTPLTDNPPVGRPATPVSAWDVSLGPGGPQDSDPLDGELDRRSTPVARGFVESIDQTEGSHLLAGGLRARWGREFHRLLDNSIRDYRRFYSPPELFALAGGIGLAAVFANTKIDQYTIDENFQQWHDENVGTHNARKFAYIVREFGNGRHFLPFYGVCIGAGEAWGSNPTARVLGEWGDRSLRSFIVGAPVILALQYGLGANRPEDHTNGSRWVPFFAENSASGHAFIGGINFMNAAMMTDNVPLKSALYVASVVPGWTRIIQDKHYVSQVVLGWWVAYLSASVVDWNEQQHSDWQITPVVSDQGAAIWFSRAW